MSFDYNSSGLRTKKTVNGEEKQYFYSGDLLVSEYDGVEYTNFTYGPNGEPVGFSFFDVESNEPMGYYYYLKNIQGDIIGLIDFKGEIECTYSYDAWGKFLGAYDENGNAITHPNSAALSNPLRYRGYYYDDETGLYYLNSRYYNPEWGTFISADTVEVATASLEEPLYDKSLYAYCDNNPISRKDYNGCYWNVVIGAVLGGAINGISTAIEKGTTQEVVTAIVCGAVSGGFSATGFGGIAGQMIVGGLASAIETCVKNYRQYNDEKMNLKEAIAGTLVDAGLGATFAAVGFEGTGALKKSNQIVKKSHKRHKNHSIFILFYGKLLIIKKFLTIR